MSESAWPDDLFAALKRWNVGLVAHVPDAGHKRLIAMVHPDRGGTDGQVHEANAARDLLLDELPHQLES